MCEHKHIIWHHSTNDYRYYQCRDCKALIGFKFMIKGNVKRIGDINE